MLYTIKRGILFIFAFMVFIVAIARPEVLAWYPSSVYLSQDVDYDLDTLVEESNDNTDLPPIPPVMIVGIIFAIVVPIPFIVSFLRMENKNKRFRR